MGLVSAEANAEYIRARLRNSRFIERNICCEVEMSIEKIEAKENKEEKLISQISQALKSIHYGYIQITVQDAKVVQVEKVEKFRIKDSLGLNT